MEPRKLTDEEIQDILNIVPNIKSPVDNVSVANTKSLKVLFREQLQDIIITPLGISELKSEILRQFNESIITPGESVGVSASESFGKNTTQSVLNSFHSAGSSKNVSYGVERISELINASKETKKPSCTIYFKDEFLSFDDIIIKKRPEFTNITVQKLVLGVPDVESYDNITEPDWYDLYRTLVRDDFKSKYVLRLNIDVNMLYAYKLTMEDICSNIEKDGTVICVYSPMYIGKIDIYPIEKIIGSKLSGKGLVSYENSSLVFLSTIVIPYLDKVTISGITGIQQIYPVESPVWQIVKEEQDAGINKGIQEWFLILNPVRMKITGIGPNKVAKLCEISGIKVVLVKPNYILVQSEISPSKKVLELVEKDNQEEKEYEKIKKEEKLPIRPQSEISINSKLVYADTTGSNFIELLGNSDVDSTRTFCNNVHEIKEALGIEAARSFLIKEFTDVFGDDGYINPRHIVLLSDYMTSLGKLSGVTFTGVSNQDISALEKASFEKAMNVFKEAAAFGDEKSVSGVSSSIFIGKKALVGTGYSKDYIKPENLERYNETRAQLIKDPNMTLDANAFNDAIEQFNMGGTEDFSFLENAEEMMFAPLPKTEPKEVPKASIVDPKDIFMTKGEILRSSEFNEAAKELEDQMMEQITCTKLKVPEINVTSGGINTLKIKPMPLPSISRVKPQPVKIFDLDEFLK